MLQTINSISARWPRTSRPRKRRRDVNNRALAPVASRAAFHRVEHGLALHPLAAHTGRHDAESPCLFDHLPVEQSFAPLIP